MTTPELKPMPDEFEDYYWKCSDHKYEQSDAEKMYCKLYTRPSLPPGTVRKVRYALTVALQIRGDVHPKDCEPIYEALALLEGV